MAGQLRDSDLTDTNKGTIMRELVITTLRNTKWFENLYNEYEGNPPLLEALTDIELLDLYVRWC